MSVGPQIHLTYHLANSERPYDVTVCGDGSICGEIDVSDLGLCVEGNEEVRRLSVCPRVSVVIDAIRAVLHLAIGDADAIYLNGYNSWTDSIERPVDDRMWGLTRVPRSLVDAYVLDGGGDYRFVREDARRGHQHGFGYGYLRQGDQVLLFGSLNEDSGLTVIWEDLEVQTITLDKEPPLVSIRPNEQRELFSMALVGGTLDEATNRWLKLSGTKARPARPVVGYSSWYRHYGNIDAWKLSKDLAGVYQVLGGADTVGMDAVFQIDDGYAEVGDWLDYDRSRFPEGLAGIAQLAREKGLLPGLWLAPFVCERDSRLYAEHPDWLLRGVDGELVTTGSQWSGGIALDVRNHEVRDYVREVLRTVTQTWGFGLLKLDFLYAACLEAHDGLNRGELMADALDLLRDAVGEDTRLLLCGVPLVPAFGRCEYCRVGCDVSLDWDDKPHMRLLHRERVSTKWSLANARGRAHLDRKAFRCDPDILFLREEGVSFTDEQRKEMLETDTTCGGVLFTSDDMSGWNAAQLDAFHRALDRYRAYNGL